LGNWLHGLGIDLNGIDNCVILPTESGKGIIASVHRGDHLGKIYDGKDVVQDAYAILVRKVLTDARTGNLNRRQTLDIIDEFRTALLTGEIKLYNE
ncbi:MAG: AHH domain-containing protein, partial [Planctomycetales bacterium]|nr:AHH domain-containing protein [Planctomycetales bacterium]